MISKGLTSKVFLKRGSIQPQVKWFIIFTLTSINWKSSYKERKKTNATRLIPRHLIPFSKESSLQLIGKRRGKNQTPRKGTTIAKGMTTLTQSLNSCLIGDQMVGDTPWKGSTHVLLKGGQIGSTLIAYLEYKLPFQKNEWGYLGTHCLIKLQGIHDVFRCGRVWQKDVQTHL